MIVVATKDVVENSDVVLAAMAALEVRMLVCLAVRNNFRHFTMSVHNEFIRSNRLMSVIFLFL